jgi:ribosome-binding ATPase YchF (GTP1/OBG family)
MFASARIVPATVLFVDIAGIVKGASEGAGLGNKFPANIRESDAICQVVRVRRPDVVHVEGRVDPASDIDDLDGADPRRLQTLEKAVPRCEGGADAEGPPPALAAAEAAGEILNAGRTPSPPA